MQITPLKIKKNHDSSLSINWSNGTESRLSFSDLRFYCRCAECVDEWTRKRKISRDAIPATIQPLAIVPVGRYAIQVDWNDGHKTGIYPYDLLYSLSQNQGN